MSVPPADRFSALTEALAEGVAQLSPTGQVLESSARWRAFTGEDSRDRPWWSLLHADERAEAEAAFHRARQERTALELSVRVRRAGGEHAPARLKLVPLLGAGAQPDGWVAALSDTSALEAARHSEERLRLATEAARVAVWEYDFIAGHMTRTENHDALYGLVPQGVWTYDLFIKATHPDDRALSDRHVQACVAPGGPDDYAFDFRVIWPDGSVHWLAVSGHVAARDPGGTATLVRGALIDVTRLKEAEGELRGAVQARDEFLQIAGHELKTPLTPLMLKLAKLLRESSLAPQRAWSGEELRPQLEAAQRQVVRLSELVEGLLDVGRVSQKRLTLERRSMDLSELVRELVEQFAAQAERARCQVETALLPGLTGEWDRARIDQVVANLLTNAFKYGAGKPVHVQTRRAGKSAELVVEDRGIGISPDALPRLFGKFERAVSDRHYGGLGLGLFIVREILEAHGGTICATSELGRGARFTVTLPL